MMLARITARVRPLLLLALLLPSAAASATTAVTLERDGAAVANGEVCRFPAGDRVNPIGRWLSSQETTCVAAGTPIELPAGLWNVFGRSDGAISADPVLVDGSSAPSQLILHLVPAATLVPKPEIAIRDKGGKTGLVYFGANTPAVHEALDLLERDGLKVNALRIKAFPFTREVASFCAMHERVFVVEQNRDAQMRSLLMTEANVPGEKLIPALSYDGTPMTAQFVRGAVTRQLRPAQAAAE